MSAGQLDIIIEKGSTFKKTFTLKDIDRVPIDLTGFTARMSVKSRVGSSITILNLTTENGGILNIDPANGKIQLYSSDTDTTAITHMGNAIYDLELINTIGEVIKLLKGTVTFLEEVTK